VLPGATEVRRVSLVSSPCRSRSRAVHKRRRRTRASTCARTVPFIVVLRWRRAPGSLRPRPPRVRYPANLTRTVSKVFLASAPRRTNCPGTADASTVTARRMGTVAAGAFAFAADRSGAPVYQQHAPAIRIAQLACYASAHRCPAVVAGPRLRVKASPTNASVTETVPSTRPILNTKGVFSKRANDPASPAASSCGVG
jgi:hypothetical protein